MERIRAQHGPMSFVGNLNGTPDYDNVEDVQSDVKSLMGRMKTLTDFIHNQNELAASLGVPEQNNDLQEEQIQLQKKLVELKNRKQQMTNLVNELQTLNIQADSAFQTRRSQTPTRNVPIEYERIVPIELLQNTARINGQMPNIAQSTPQQQQQRYVSPLVRNANDGSLSQPDSLQLQNDNDDQTIENDDDEEDDDAVAAAAVAEEANDASLNDKIAELNAMKNQLKRLQEMMETVKMIEIKTDDCPPSEIGYEAKPNNANGHDTNSVTENASVNNENPPRDDEEQQMVDRVRALHSMTNDLRQQAVLLAGERDRLKDIKNEMTRRRDFENSEKNVVQKPTQPQHVCDENKFDASDARRYNKKAEPVSDRSFYDNENWQQNLNGSIASSLQSGRYADGRQSDGLSSKPPNQGAAGQCKESTDSNGGRDALNMSIEAASLHSGSSRGFSVPPPMRNIGNREAGEYNILDIFIKSNVLTIGK